MGSRGPILHGLGRGGAWRGPAGRGGVQCPAEYSRGLAGSPVGSPLVGTPTPISPAFASRNTRREAAGAGPGGARRGFPRGAPLPTYPSPSLQCFIVMAAGPCKPNPHSLASPPRPAAALPKPPPLGRRAPLGFLSLANRVSCQTPRTPSKTSCFKQLAYSNYHPQFVATN